MSDYAENAIDATIAHQPSPGERFYPAFEVTPELDAAASEYVTHYPEGKQKSAVLPILHEIQKKFGFISGDAIAWVGEKLNISAAHVLGVVTFYPGLRLGIDKNGIDHHHPIGVSPDGLWSVEGVECLANCGFGPNMMVNDLLYEKVTPEVLEEVIAKYQTA